VLVGTMGCQWALASAVEDALASIEAEKPSAVVLDLPNGISDPERLGQSFSELFRRSQGRLVVVTSERATTEMVDLEKKHSIPFVQRERLMMDLWPCLATLMSSQPTIRRITQVARLVMDTFLQPMPAGIRCSRPNMRQLVYEADHLTADVSLERLPDSTMTAACGQIMRDADPRIPLNGVPVIMKVEKGPIELKMTNQSGEFSFEFENEQHEQKVTFEIEINSGHWIVIVSPVLEWSRAATANAN